MPNKNMTDTVTLDLSHIYFLQSCSDIKAEKVQDFFCICASPCTL